MPYTYQRHAPAPTGENPADIYTVHDVGCENRHLPSPELVAAVDRLPPSAQKIIRALLTVGFQAVVKK